MNNVYVIDAVRTPIGKFGGALGSIRPDDLLAHVIRVLLARNAGADPAAIEDVIAGDANQAGEDNRNVARMAALLAVMDAARAIACGEGELYIAGGVESMTRAPFVMGKASHAFSRNAEIFDSTIGWRFVNRKLAEAYHPYSMGETAENVARQWKVSREAQDAFGLASQEKYFTALAAGKWAAELAPVEILGGKQEKIYFDTDEQPRHSSMDKMAALRPAFIKEGTVTAGNAAGINDGAAAMLLASEAAVTRYGLKPMARVVSMAVAGVDPAIMGVGPIPATKKALQRAGLSVGDLGLAELNEAFAVQALVCMQELGLDPSLAARSLSGIRWAPAGCGSLRRCCMRWGGRRGFVMGWRPCVWGLGRVRR